jgi:hypothetical protein
MSNPHWQKMYNQLKPRELAVMSINANASGDLAEADRLLDTGPRFNPNVTICAHAALRLVSLIAIHAGLHLAACGDFMLLANMMNKKGATERREDYENGLTVIAWRIIVRADAWQCVCAELGLDPIGAFRAVGLAAELEGESVIYFAEMIARERALTLEDVRDALRRLDVRDYNPPTAESIAAEYRSLLDSPVLRMQDARAAK